MKKLLSIIIIAAITVITVFPASAADNDAAIEQELYDAYTARAYAEYSKQYDDLITERPDYSIPKLSPDEYTDAHPISDFFIFEYMGRYGENNLPAVVIAEEHLLGLRMVWLGDYLLNTGCIYSYSDGYDVIHKAVLVYSDGEFIALTDAYAEGLIENDDLDAIYGKNFIGGCSGSKLLYRIGDMNGDSKLDILDLIAIKNYIMQDKYPQASDEDFRDISDFDKSGYTDVNDMTSLKSYIMNN